MTYFLDSNFTTKKESNLTEKEKKSPTVNTQAVFAAAAIAKVGR